MLLSIICTYENLLKKYSKKYFFPNMRNTCSKQIVIFASVNCLRNRRHNIFTYKKLVGRQKIGKGREKRQEKQNLKSKQSMSLERQNQWYL